MLDLLIYAIVTWRVTSMLSAEHGPWGIFDSLRKMTAGKPYIKLDCFWCTSVQVGLLMALFTTHNFLVYGLVYSTVAIIIDHFVSYE